MEVVRKGRPQQGWSKMFESTGIGNGRGGCGAVLLVSEHDLYYTYSSCMGESEKHITFMCPDCGVETDIERPTGAKVRGKRPAKKED